MNPLNYKMGSIFENDAKYIVHQCNCVTMHAKGLSKMMFSVYPYADCYRCRVSRNEPGTIQIAGDGNADRFVVNLFGQVYPGAPRFTIDDRSARLSYFRKGLREMSKITDLESVAFPHGIGCGLGGGIWQDYEQAIVEFASATKARVTIVRLAVT
jgi:O-acetyl-ADP-ribose deacetylase (regulator of RNase III)